MAEEEAPRSSAPQPVQETAAGGIAVGFLVAGMFLLGFVALVLGGAFAYSLGVPMVLIAVVAVALLAGVFSLLRRWAED